MIDNNKTFTLKKSLAIGYIKVLSNKYAFATINKNEDIFIPPKKTGYSLTGDKVLLKINEKENKIKGEVIKILKRTKKKIIGILKIPNSKNNEIKVKSKDIHVNIIIKNKKLKKINNNNKVIIKIIDWVKGDKYPLGKIIKILGKKGDHIVEMKSILTQYEIPYKFPKKVIKEAEKIKNTISKKEIKKRKDIRSVTTFTIDPIDAKDFDDAISIKELKNGNWEIGIHIADVSYYVKENSIIDKEAYKRSSSTYLVDYVVPMLPEIISNELCSLKQKEDKLTFSIIFEINKKNEILKKWIGETIINSNKRFTYEEVQKIIESKKGFFYKELKIINNITKIFKKKRIKNGAINFETMNINFILNKKKNPIKIIVKENKECHNMIEELMLLANKKISEFFSLNKNKKYINSTFIYRVHDKPNIEKLKELNEFIKPLGQKINFKNKKTINNSINKLLIFSKKKKEQNIINTLTMRTMSKAIYSTKNIGHYGLSFKYYSHFTSPIRRYSDIIVHRLLKKRLLLNNKILKNNIYEKFSEHFSKKERITLEAERESIKFMQIKYLKKFTGEIFDGIVSSITNWGIYVEILPSRTDGLIRFRDILKNNKNKISEKKIKNKYKLGQKIKVKIINADIEKKQLNLNLI